MSIVLSPEVERQMEEIVRAEGFESPDHFLRAFFEKYAEHRREAFAWLENHRQAIDAMLEEGLSDLREGRSTLYDSDGLKALAEDIKRDGRLRMARPTETR